VSKGVSDKPEGKIGRREGKACAAADVKRRDLKEVSLPIISWLDEGKVRGESFERDDGREDRGTVDKGRVRGEVEERGGFEFCDGSPLVAGFVGNNNELVRMFVLRRVNARWRKVWRWRRLRELTKRFAVLLFFQRRRWRARHGLHRDWCWARRRREEKRRRGSG
jgi:hypothetical protein